MTERKPVENAAHLLSKMVDSIPVAETPGIAAIRVERLRQIGSLGWDADHDDGHADRELALVASDLLREEEDDWGIFMKNRHDPLRRLEIAGALVAAEYDRVFRIIFPKEEGRDDARESEDG